VLCVVDGHQVLQLRKEQTQTIDNESLATSQYETNN
jgi:hypothetical protein